MTHVHNNLNHNDSHHPFNHHDLNHAQHHVFSVKFYLKMFGLLVAFFVLNIFIFKSSISAPYNTILLLSVAIIQAGIVAFFFMELIHEEKFFTFIFLSTILFIILFLGISLLEIPARNFFHPDEGAHILRGYDQEGVYAPAMPKKEVE